MIPDAVVAYLTDVAREQNARDESGWTSTPYRKWLEDRQAELCAVRKNLSQSAAFALRRFHDRPGADLQGWPLPIEEDATRRSFGLILEDLSTLEEETGWLIKDLPHHKHKAALPLVCNGLLHAFIEFDLPRPAVHENAPAVVLLEKIFQGAGREYSREHLKRALRQALIAWNPHHIQPEIRDLWQVISNCQNAK